MVEVRDIIVEARHTVADSFGRLHTDNHYLHSHIKSSLERKQAGSSWTATMCMW